MLLFETFLSPVRDCFPAQVAIIALLLLILLDWVFGIGNACMKHEFSSEKMRQGIGHKCSELGFVMLGVVMDAMITSGLDIGLPVRHGNRQPARNLCEDQSPACRVSCVQAARNGSRHPR